MHPTRKKHGKSRGHFVSCCQSSLRMCLKAANNIERIRVAEMTNVPGAKPARRNTAQFFVPQINNGQHPTLKANFSPPRTTSLQEFSRDVSSRFSHGLSWPRATRTCVSCPPFGTLVAWVTRGTYIQQYTRTTYEENKSKSSNGVTVTWYKLVTATTVSIQVRIKS